MGYEIEYIVQNAPEGLAQAYILAEKFVGDYPSALILGDNLLWNKLSDLLKEANSRKWRNNLWL